MRKPPLKNGGGFFQPRAYVPGARFFGKITSFNNFFTKIFVQNYDLYFPYYLL